MSIYAVLAAGGSGTRMGAGKNKVLLSLCGIPVLCRSISLFENLIDEMVVVYRESDAPDIRRLIDAAQPSFPVKLVPGGNTRQHSVLNGLKALPAKEDDIVLVHDAARCITPRTVIEEVIQSCIVHGSGVPGIPAVNTMKYVGDNGFVLSTADRSCLYEIQTPQAFRCKPLLDAYLTAEAGRFSATDDASVMEHAGFPVHITKGSKMNLKITEKEDIPLAESFIARQAGLFRIGTGYDVHRFADGRRLVLCGVDIPHTKGLLGHSDADVALHALMDAMFGAAALGDIGKHFPDSDEAYKGISSLVLLQETYGKVQDAGYTLVNADITIVAQKPKIGPFIPEMISTVSRAIGCSSEQISIKATTTEKLGFEGREEGISAQAVCMLQRMSY